MYASFLPKPGELYQTRRHTYRILKLVYLHPEERKIEVKKKFQYFINMDVWIVTMQYYIKKVYKSQTQEY